MRLSDSPSLSWQSIFALTIELYDLVGLIVAVLNLNGNLPTTKVLQ